MLPIPFFILITIKLFHISAVIISQYKCAIHSVNLSQQQCLNQCIWNQTQFLNIIWIYLDFFFLFSENFGKPYPGVAITPGVIEEDSDAEFAGDTDEFVGKITGIFQELSEIVDTFRYSAIRKFF